MEEKMCVLAVFKFRRFDSLIIPSHKPEYHLVDPAQLTTEAYQHTCSIHFLNNSEGAGSQEQKHTTVASV